MLTTIACFPIRTEVDVKAAAQRARLLGTLVDLPDRQRTAFGRAVREIVGNVLQHATAGQIEFRIESSSGSRFVEAVVSDQAGGRAEIEAVLAQATGPDCGLRRANSILDRLLVESSESGKLLRAGVQITAQLPHLDETNVAEWAGMLRTRRTLSALASTQRRGRELAEQLANVHRQRQQLEFDLQQTRSVNETLTLLSLVASKTDNAVIIMDSNGLATWVNDAFIRMTGFTMEEAIGSRPEKLLAGAETSRDSLRDLQLAFKLGHGVSEEFVQYRRDGSTGWISLSLTPIYDDKGQVTRWIGIGSDITKRKDAERALKTARDAAQTASRLKGEFLANISHEIRTPMNAIIGMTDLTLCTPLNNDQREYLTTVKQSGESLLELLNDVLDLSKIESGRMEISEFPFDLRSVVRDTLRPLTFVAGQKQLRLSLHVSPDVPHRITADPLRLRQILVNLVGNAIKFTQRGQVDVFVQQQWEADSEVGLQFTIEDTGPGIPADKLDQIFEAFHQADASITRQFGGTGLGLTITAQLLKLMNGRVWVQSEPGTGSRFHFTLRCHQSTAAEQHDVSRTAAARLTDDQCIPTATRPLRILVVDDHAANRQLLAKILEKSGHSTRFAENGHEAIRLFESHPFDLVLMDVQMPEMDGYQATTAIRERERESRTHVPVIAVTAHAMQGDREVCLAAGMDAYLSKPITTVELLTLVNSLTNNQINVSASVASASGYVDVHQPPQEPQRRVQDNRSSSSGPRDSGHDADRSDDSAPAAAAGRTFTGALSRLDNDEELLREQMQFFLHDGPELLRMMDCAIRNNDPPALQIAAHRLKNLCAMFDDEDTAARCSELEYLGKAGRFEALTDLHTGVNRAVQTLLEAIQSF